MESLAMDSNQSVEFEFRQQLMQHHIGKKQNSVLISKADYFKIIQDLKDANHSEAKNRRQYYLLSRFVTKVFYVS
jgi:hypothetical protein